MQRLNSLRLRLLIINTVVLLGLSVFIIIVVNLTNELNISLGENNTLELYATGLMGDLDGLESGATEAEMQTKEKNYQVFIEGLKKAEIAYMVLNHDFQTLEQSEQLWIDGQALKNLAINYMFLKKQGHWLVDYQYQGLELKICTLVKVNDQGEVRVVQVIKNKEKDTALLYDTMKIVTLIIFIGFVASILCGYFLSGRALIPIKKNIEHQQEFLADASHELRTPIAVIQSNLEVLKTCDVETVESQKEWINNAYGEVRRMHGIVEDLMFLARADSGELPKEIKVIDCAYLIREVRERLYALAKEKQITLIANIKADELPIRADENQILQLLIIFLENAIKYSDNETQIQIIGRIKENMVELQVKDQGCGIPEEDQKRIFERFYRVNKERSRKAGGTGLGLSIASYIASENKGNIRVESIENVGTTMTVEFQKAIIEKEKKNGTIKI